MLQHHRLQVDKIPSVIYFHFKSLIIKDNNPDNNNMFWNVPGKCAVELKRNPILFIASKSSMKRQRKNSRNDGGDGGGGLSVEVKAPPGLGRWI